MFDSYELPQPEEIGGMSDAGLVDAMTVATLMETVAIEVRLAAMEEMYARQVCSSPTRRPATQRPQAALPSSRRRRKRRQRKRRNRR